MLLKSCSSQKRKFNVEAEGSSSRVLEPPCSSDERIVIKTEDVDEDTCKRIRAGCDDFLCAEELGKNFLLCGGKYNNDLDSTERRAFVSISEVLHKKNVGILFLETIGLLDYIGLRILNALKQVYYQLKQQQQGGAAAFEIVFVANIPSNFEEDDSGRGDDRENLFNAYLDQMPWLAVPFRDAKKWRKRLLKRYHSYGNSLVLFDPNGRRLARQDGALQKLTHHFGPDFYPFTKDREKELIDKYYAPFRSPNKSLEALLGRPGRDFLISYGDGDGDYKKVAISQLHGSGRRLLIGLYFFHGDVLKDQNRFMTELEVIRRRTSSERDTIFEIVFVNADFDGGYSSERSFHLFLKKWPWLLALPLRDEKIRALLYAVGKRGSLIIIDDDFCIERDGHRIINDYGFDAFPFTREAAIGAAKNRLTQLHLTDFFHFTGTTYLLSPEMLLYKHASFLENKKVILYISDSTSDRGIYKLLYWQKKENNSFEVLFFVPWCVGRSSLDHMPKNWVGFPCYPADIDYPAKHVHELISDTVKFDMEFDIIVFDETGKLLKTGLLELFNDDETFPFVSDEAYDNEFRRLIREKKWD